MVVDEHEHPHPAVVRRPGHGGIGAPADVGGVRDHPAVVESRAASLGRPLGSEEADPSHEAQHPVLAHTELVLPAQACPDFAVALAGKGTVHDHLADPLGELVVGDLGLRTRAAPRCVHLAPAAIDRGSRCPVEAAHPGEGDPHFGAHLGRFCGGIESPLFLAMARRISLSMVSSPIFRSA